MSTRSFLAAAAALALIGTPSAHAGLYGDDLSRCLVESTSPADKISLVKWMFTAISLHPAVQSLSSIPAGEVDATNKATAELFTRLLTETCRDQSVKAVKYEGVAAVQSSFQVLGQVAAGEIFSSPQVAAGMASMSRYTDKRKLEAVFGKPKE